MLLKLRRPIELSQATFRPPDYLPVRDGTAVSFARVCDGSEGVVERIAEKETVGCAASVDDVDHSAMPSGLS
jgi:hypothetical protein